MVQQDAQVAVQQGAQGSGGGEGREGGRYREVGIGWVYRAGYTSPSTPLAIPLLVPLLLAPGTVISVLRVTSKRL